MANAPSKIISSLLFVVLNVMQHITGDKIVYSVVQDFLLQSEQDTLSNNCFFFLSSNKSLQIILPRFSCLQSYVNELSALYIFSIEMTASSFSSQFSLLSNSFFFWRKIIWHFQHIFLLFYVVFFLAFRDFAQCNIHLFGSIICIEVKHQYSSICES